MGRTSYAIIGVAYRLLRAADAFWRPSNQMRVVNTDLGKQLEASTLGARLWRLAPGQASTRHRHLDQEELYVLLEGSGRVADRRRGAADPGAAGHAAGRARLGPPALQRHRRRPALARRRRAAGSCANTLEMSEEQLRRCTRTGRRRCRPSWTAERRGPARPGTRLGGSRARPASPSRARAGRWLLAVAVAGSGMAFLDGTVVNVALPDIGRDLGASTSALQWILNGYLLTLASLILLGGSLGDRYGRRRIFVLGVGLFTAASLLCAVAPSAELLIVARLLQGVGGALLTPGSLAMIEASFRPGDRARAIGAWSGLGGVAAALGPLLGGYLVGADLLAGDLPDQPADRRSSSPGRRPGTCRRRATRWPSGRLDLRGAVLAALGLAGTTYALIEAPGRGASAAILVAAHRRRPRARRLLRRRAPQRQPDAAAGDLPLAPVQRRERGHLRRLRGARRLLLPARRLPADLARLHADRGRRRLAAGDRC